MCSDSGDDECVSEIFKNKSDRAVCELNTDTAELQPIPTVSRPKKHKINTNSVQTIEYDWQNDSRFQMKLHIFDSTNSGINPNTCIAENSPELFYF